MRSDAGNKQGTNAFELEVRESQLRKCDVLKNQSSKVEVIEMSVAIAASAFRFVPGFPVSFRAHSIKARGSPF